jgi:histidyl-tRNA synthetase
MDYYNRTVFEWVTDKLGAQATVCGGGRYDPLVEMLGGRSAPSCGFAIGVERLLDLAAQAGAMDAESSTDVYVVSSGEGTLSAALRASEQMRAAGLDVLMHAGGGSFKSQFKRADASGATLALVIGEDELARGEFGLKWLRAGGSVDSTDLQARGRQQAVPVDRLVETVVAALTDEEEG